jgi:biotin-dependent carboxylase-like uncharacterized protein
MMRSVLVRRAGLQSAIVDAGRFGYRDRGVAWCGPSDALAFALAQRLAGNGMPCAALEVVMGDVELAFETPARCAIAGADCAATLDGERVPNWSAFTAASGSRLTLRRPRTWMRTILAFDGGIDVPEVLGSRTTDLATHIGGLEGRALRAGDRLTLGPASSRSMRRIAIKPPHADFAAEAFNASPLPVRVLAEPGFDALWERTWSVGHESNRMGCRLRGEPLAHMMGNVASHGVFPGVVQLPPGGEPIVLLGDAQTTGGYSVAGIVIEADLWMLGQVRARQALRLVPVTLEEANAASERVRAYVSAVAAAIAGACA